MHTHRSVLIEISMEIGMLNFWLGLLVTALMKETYFRLTNFAVKAENSITVEAMLLFLFYHRWPIFVSADVYLWTSSFSFLLLTNAFFCWWTSSISKFLKSTLHTKQLGEIIFDGTFYFAINCFWNILTFNT